MSFLQTNKLNLLKLHFVTNKINQRQRKNLLRYSAKAKGCHTKTNPSALSSTKVFTIFFTVTQVPTGKQFVVTEKFNILLLAKYFKTVTHCKVAAVTPSY